MNLKLVLPILFAVISTFALADELLISQVLKSGFDSNKLLPHHAHLKKLQKDFLK